MEKTALFSYLFVLCCLTNSTAQIAEQSAEMSLGFQNALILDIPESNKNLIDKLWKSYIKNYSGKTRKGKKGEWLTEGADIVSIGGANTLNIYARSEQMGTSTKMFLWIQLEESFLSSEAETTKYIEAEKLLMRFGL